MSPCVDPIDFELFKNALFAAAAEMAVTVCRTTYSGVLRDNMDFSTSITDARGNVVAQGLTLPMHLGSVRTALAAVLARYGNDVREGDVYALNDPFEGGMHLPDIFMFKPVFVNGAHVAFACCTAHQADGGGRVPGSNAADSTGIYQEGLRIPPMKLLDGGECNETLWRLIERNVRIPVQVFGDLRAQLAAGASKKRWTAGSDSGPPFATAGGLSTKLHAACTDERTGVSFALSGGERHDTRGFKAVWEGVPGGLGVMAWIMVR